jgi:hypothetical protein
MFKISDSDSDTESRHTRNGKVFRGVHLENLFKQNYREEDFYSGEEVDLTDEEHPEPTVVVENTRTTERGGVNQLFISLNNFMPFNLLLRFLHVSSTNHTAYGQ